TLDQELGSLIAHVVHVLIDTREPDVFTCLDVVVPDEGDVIGNRFTGITNGLPGSDGLHVAAGKKRRNRRVDFEQALHRLVARLLTETGVFGGPATMEE